MGGARACVWHVSAEHVADDVKLQGRKSRRQIIYLRHSVCDGIFGELKERKEEKKWQQTRWRLCGFTDQPSQMWLISITQRLCSVSTPVADAAHLT